SPRDLEDSYGMNEGCAPGVCKNVSSVGRCDARRLGELKRRILLSESFSDHFLLGVSEDAKTHSDRPQTPDRIVLTNGQAELGPRCEKPIRFVHSARNQVVDQNSDVGSLSTENEWLLSLDCKRSIQSCHQPLTGGLFVAGRTIYLAGEVKTRNRSDLEGSVELCGRIVVVLDSVARSIHFYIGKSAHRAKNLELHFRGERCREPVDVKLLRVVTFRLQKELMPIGLRKLHDLVLDRRTVTRPA